MSETLISRLDSLCDSNMFSVLVETNSYEKTLNEITEFITSKLGDKLLLSDHPDVLLIGSSCRNINLSEVSQVEYFMQTSSIYSGKKFLILKDLEFVNKYASHILLAQIENLQPNHFIFLLTKNLSMIIRSIYTRVFKIRNLYFDVEEPLNELHTSFFLQSKSVIDKINLMYELAKRDNFYQWRDFIANTEALLRRLFYKSLFQTNNLSKIEEEIFYQFSNRSSIYFFKILQKIYYRFNLSIRYDLDVKSTMLIILDEFNEQNI